MSKKTKKTSRFMNNLKPIFLFLAFFIVISGIYAQSEGEVFPNTDFWALDAGIGMTDILVEGLSFQFILEPKLSVTSKSMVGAKFGVNYSAEQDSRNILTFETQAFYRWNFLRFGKKDNNVNIFLQGGLGLLAAYRGNAEEPNRIFSDVTMTRGSLLADAALGITIPLSQRWHIEPSIRGGYPHIAGASITAGYKFPIRHRTERYTETETIIEYRDRPPNEILRQIVITAVEYIIFGPDITEFNVGIDNDAAALNTLVLDYVVNLLRDNPHYRVRIEGHANPINIYDLQVEELERVSTERVNTVQRLLRERGVSEEQLVVASFGGTRVVASDAEHRNMNRRVELIVVHIDTDF